MLQVYLGAYLSRYHCYVQKRYVFSMREYYFAVVGTVYLPPSLGLLLQDQEYVRLCYLLLTFLMDLLLISILYHIDIDPKQLYLYRKGLATVWTHLEPHPSTILNTLLIVINRESVYMASSVLVDITPGYSTEAPTPSILPLRWSIICYRLKH